MALSGCAIAKGRSGNTLPPATFVGSDPGVSEQKYVIGALDQLNIFVWRNQELSVKVQVRPDGRITTPLISDMVAAGKTTSQLADEIREALRQYIEDPRVSVMVDNFQGTFGQQTLLDAMIEVGGLSQYAAGNRARLIRHDPESGEQREYDLKIARLLKKGDTRANVRLEPGDVIIIPESMF